MYCKMLAVPELRRLVAGFPPWWPRFEPGSGHVGCGGLSVTGVGFIRVLRFPVPIFIPQTAPQSPSSIIWGWYNRPVVPTVPSGFKTHRTKKKKKSNVTVKKQTCNYVEFEVFMAITMKNALSSGMLHCVVHTRTTWRHIPRRWRSSKL
jgi:hypothetical protein